MKDPREQAREIAKWCEHADKSLHPIQNRERFACADCIAAALERHQGALALVLEIPDNDDPAMVALRDDVRAVMGVTPTGDR